MKKHLIIILLLFTVFFNLNTYTIQAMDEPTDITNHWAQDYIYNLLNKDILNVYPDGTFKPDQPITRGEFAQGLAKHLNLLPSITDKFSDLEAFPGKQYVNALVEEGILNGYPDGTFRPNNPITRAELTKVIIKALGIKGDEETISLVDFRPFNDIPENHWALDQIEIATKLGLISENPENKFFPDRKTTRAEAAKLLSKLENLSGNTGYITDIYPTSNKVSVNLLNGNRKVYNLSSQTLIGRNNRLVSIDDILKTDKVFIIADANQVIQYMKAYGMVTQDDLATEVSQITDGLLSTDDVKALADGNISILRPKLYTSIQDQMVKEGLTAPEVEAIMQTDWDQLESLSKDRLAEAVAIQTGLPLDITKSIMAGDWEKLKTYAQIEVVQRVVREMLNSDIIS